MTSIKDFLTQDHRDCDNLFTEMENAVAAKNSQAAQLMYSEFDTALNHHFDMEEKVMFPAFETKTGMTQGPTQMMRLEHAQMRKLVLQMKEALDANDDNRFMGLSETLMITMQQHNMKEEQMLYTMAQQHLAADAQDIIKQMQAI